ncbi:MAG: hypothetical protein Q8O86_06840, partial [Dehalococcoidia bacterium]|nr:hypothetical protein [Dehalococcoidia bacterium]
MKALLLALALLAAAASSCLPQFQAGNRPPVSSSEWVADEAPNIPVPPNRDLFDVAQRLRPGSGPIPRTVGTAL